MASVAIIEDEPDLAEVYAMMLEAERHTVIATVATPDALIAAPAAPDAVDVIILDEHLRNGASGVPSIPSLRVRFPRARVILATADPAAIAHPHNADAVLLKPFALKDLIGAVETPSRSG
jgi:DNA-binding response OmpR family regulator